MSENKSSKKLIIIIIAIALLIAGLFIIKPWDKKPVSDNEETPCENCTVEKDENDPFNLTYSGETVKYNAYDFIIEKMSQAQYWTYDEYHPKYVCTDTSHMHDDVIVNGTGFILYDEDTASFVRGYASRLILNFSEFKSESADEFGDTINDYKDNPWGGEIDIVTGEPCNGSVVYIDFNAKTFEREYVATENSREFVDGWYEQEITSPQLKSVPNTYTNEIKNTFEFYENIFSKLGIPLLNQPAGTLASYKNKTIDVPVELIELKYYDRINDGKYHWPLKEEFNFDYYWENDQDNVWLDDYREIMNKQFPKSTENERETFCFVDEDRDIWVNYYAPLFLIMANKNEFTRDLGRGFVFTGTASEFDLESPHEVFAKSNGIGEAMVTYWLKPLYKHIFGFNGVYFVDRTKLEENPYNVSTMRTPEEFEKGLRQSTNNAEIVPVFDKGEYATDPRYHLNGDWDGLVGYMQDICDHYGVENPYAKDYIYNLYLIYAPEEQSYLGLR